MYIIISPSKSLNFGKLERDVEKTKIQFTKEAFEISSVLKKYSPKELSSLMNISDNLSMLNWRRNQEYKEFFDDNKSKQAIFAFTGAVYSEIDIYSLNDVQINYLQANLRILSGQYGMLKPLDKIMPYRLEMGIKLKVNNCKNLYEYWREIITKEINKHESDFIVNLASNEYFKVINKKDLNAKVITPIFKDYKKGKLKTIAIFAKKARGMMVKYMAENKITNNINKLKEFNGGGYRFDENISSDTTFVFTR